TGIGPAIRKLFAKTHGVDAGLFSANSTGACPECNGTGVVFTDLAFMDGHSAPCEACGGTKFNDKALSYTIDGLTIADIEALTVAEARRRLDVPDIGGALRHIAEVGLGYLTLGQPLSTLSGGECQRLKIAKELRATAGEMLYVLDEPTTGLHLDDIDTLLGVLDRLVDTGNTVVVIEHNLTVIRRADWIVDLGPGPGRHGGRVLFEGTPEDLADHPDSATGAALREAAPDRP
ncbi:MAG: excinuclease ABC subunit UvrA, partial [Streptomycetaceae bacterium]|nr:excinuclease ABC subunit UvrA [Streptomycetaceae bacterium]